MDKFEELMFSGQPPRIVSVLHMGIIPKLLYTNAVQAGLISEEDSLCPCG